jgi:hypothetical protein
LLKWHGYVAGACCLQFVVVNEFTEFKSSISENPMTIYEREETLTGLLAGITDLFIGKAAKSLAKKMAEKLRDKCENDQNNFHSQTLNEKT